MLRARTILLQLATPLMGLVGNPDIPTQEGGAAGYWIGEDDEAAEDLLSLGQRQFSPKTVAAYSEITRRTLKQSSMDIEALVRSDLALALASKLDLAGFYGTGTDDQPLGIANTNGVNVVDFAGAGSGGGVAMPTWAEVIQMESDIAAANADVNRMAYVQNAKMRGHFKSTQKFTGTNGAPIWESDNTVNGYRGEVTNQIANGEVFHGDFGNVLVGMFRRWSKSGGRRILARAMRPTIPTASRLRHELWSRKERTGARGYCAFRCRDRIGPGRGASEGQFRG